MWAGAAVIAAVGTLAVADTVAENSKPDEGSPPVVPPVDPSSDVSDLENDDEKEDKGKAAAEALGVTMVTITQRHYRLRRFAGVPIQHPAMVHFT
jgi:hypothetical protein